MGNRKNNDSLRNQLGMSQDYMALWLGISRSLFSMYELHERSLPTKALIKFSQIAEAWQKFQAEWQPPVENTEVVPSKKLIQKIRRLKYRQTLTRFNLENLEDLPDYQKAKAFFEYQLTQTTDPTEQAIFNLQILRHEEERKRIKSERERLKKELDLIEKQLEVLEKGLA